MILAQSKPGLRQDSGFRRHQHGDKGDMGKTKMKRRSRPSPSGFEGRARIAIRYVFAVATMILSALMRTAKRWAAPGAGPKVVSG
jgi:hypothetical protein